MPKVQQKAKASATDYLAEARDVIGEIENLRVVDGSEHLGHDGVVAVPGVALILAQRVGGEFLITLR